MSKFPQDKILLNQNWPLQILQKRLQTKWDLSFTIDELFDDYTSDEKGINDTLGYATDREVMV